MAIRLLRTQRRQPAVYWPLTTPSANQFGQASLGAPIEILVRYVEKIEIVTTPTGETRTSRGYAYVDRAMKARERLMLGALTSSTSHDPNQQGAWEIVSLKTDPTFRADEALRTVWLA